MCAKIYTKTGDQGDTGLFGGPRVPKDDLRIEAYGAVDELNAVLGLVRAAEPPQQVDHLLSSIQHELFGLGAELATPDAERHGHALVGSRNVRRLEEAIDSYDAKLAPLTQFILPGGTKVAALLHLARTVCRRAERRLISLVRREGEKISPQPVIYLNRLSDLLFVLARAANATAGQKEEPWQKPDAMG